jgi:predicted Fe-Mo cluster-binding NifX family protein
MRVGITTEEPDLEADVAQRFGWCRYLLVVDSETLSFEAVPNPGASAGAQSGIQTVILAISQGVAVVITGFLSPTAHKHLSENGIRVIQGVQGKASAGLKSLKREALESASDQDANLTADALLLALKRSARQLANLLPVMAGVILLIGLFKTFLSKQMIAAVFSGNVLEDALWGTCLGSVFTGNPINSYLIGAGLLDQGVTLFGITAFMVAWVCVGLVQLPAEIAALGKRFALARIGLCFGLAVAVSISTSGLYSLIQGSYP